MPDWTLMVPAIRAALDIAAAPAEKRDAVGLAAAQEYAVEIQKSLDPFLDPLIPYWPAPQRVPVGPDMQGAVAGVARCRQ